MTSVRRATGADLIYASHIYRDALRAVEWLPRSRPDPIDFATATDGEDVFVACNEKSDVVGFISVWTPDAFIHHLYVEPEAQRCGVGTVLLNSLDSWLPRPWTLKCVTANVLALRFYRSRGWRESGGGTGDDGPYLLLEY